MPKCLIYISAVVIFSQGVVAWAQDLDAARPISEWDAPDLGFQAIPIADNEPLMRELGIAKLPTKKGFLVVSVNPNTATAAAGLQPWQIVTTVNKKPIGTVAELRSTIESIPFGDQVLLGGYALRNNAWKAGSVKTSMMNRRNVLNASMDISQDEIDRVTLTKHRFEIDQPISAELFIVQSANKPPVLMAQFYYKARGWMFMQSATILGKDKDNSKVQITFDYGNRRSKVLSGDLIRESNTIAIPNDDLEVAKLLSTTSIVRMTGKEKTHDHSITLPEMWTNRDVFDYYRMTSQQP